MSFAHHFYVFTEWYAFVAPKLMGVNVE